MDNVSTLYGTWGSIFSELQLLVADRGTITHLIIHSPDQTPIPTSSPVLLPDVQFVHLRTHHPLDLLQFVFPPSVVHLGLEVSGDVKSSSIESECKNLMRSSPSFSSAASPAGANANSWAFLESISLSLPVSETILLDITRKFASKAVRVRIVLQATATGDYPEQVVAAFGQVANSGRLGGALTWAVAPKCRYLEVRIGQVVAKNRFMHEAMLSQARVAETIRRSQGREFRINIVM
ncbi:hypothetical protein FRC17_003865 [Serendipita sp. 399]|nr:hypothetical protein FRC17_003865 [Serendipita sp. 399]